MGPAIAPKLSAGGGVCGTVTVTASDCEAGVMVPDEAVAVTVIVCDPAEVNTTVNAQAPPVVCPVPMLTFGVESAAVAPEGTETEHVTVAARPADVTPIGTV